MPGISNFIEQKMLDHIFSLTAAYGQPTIYVALSTADPAEDNSGIAEPVGNGYARKAVPAWGVTGRTATNTNQIDFAQASGAWGTISHYAIFDALTGGNMLANGTVSPAQAVVNGNLFSLAAGSVSISITGYSDYLANAILRHIFVSASAMAQPSLYLAFSTANPLDDNSAIAEPVGNAYARSLVSAFARTLSQVANNAALSSPVSTGAWGTITYWALFDALTLGNQLGSGVMTPSQAIVNGNQIQFATGAFTWDMD